MSGADGDFHIKPSGKALYRVSSGWAIGEIDKSKIYIAMDMGVLQILYHLHFGFWDLANGI